MNCKLEMATNYLITHANR